MAVMSQHSSLSTLELPMCAIFSMRLTTWPLLFFAIKPASRVFLILFAISVMAQSQLLSCHLSLLGAR